MSLPEILPTGSLSSEEYVNYMIGYLDTALDSLDSQLNNYAAKHTVAGWDARWSQIVTNIKQDVSIITSDLNQIKAQITMLNSAI